MAIEDVRNRIISDAKTEADEILAQARSRADETLAAAKEKIAAETEEAKALVGVRAKSVEDGFAASARLDAQKILLQKKREAIDRVYEKALERLLNLEKADAVELVAGLISRYGEAGDEVVFADNFPYAKEVSETEKVKSSGVKISTKTAPLDGGLLLVGKTSDKDLSYGALLRADRDSNEAEIALRLFKD